MYATLDDSVVQHGDVYFYAHYVQHPRDETIPLVIIGRKEVIRRQEGLLASYIAAAIDDHPLVACEHYASIDPVRDLVTFFTNRTLLKDEERVVKMAFQAADFGSRVASRRAMGLYRSGALSLHEPWQDHPNLLIHLPEPLPETSRKKGYLTPQFSQEERDRLLRRMSFHRALSVARYYGNESY